MKTTDIAINKVYSILKTGNVKPLFKWLKPTNKKAPEYTVINALPVGDGVIQKCRVNVNFHAKDLNAGIPDIETLETATATIMGLVQEVAQRDIVIEFESQQYIKEPQLEEHYSNIRLSVKMLNN